MLPPVNGMRPFGLTLPFDDAPKASFCPRLLTRSGALQGYAENQPARPQTLPVRCRSPEERPPGGSFGRALNPGGARGAVEVRPSHGCQWS